MPDSFLNATKDQVVSSRITELAKVQFPDIYNVIEQVFTTAMDNMAKALQAKQKLLLPLSMLPVYGMVQYLGKTFCNSSPELVRLPLSSSA